MCVPSCKRLILKITLGENETHRTTCNSIWDESESKVSYDLLVDLVTKYAFPTHNATGLPKDYEVVVTYVDEDGDKVNISSDVELNDAVEQFVSCKPPVLRIKAELNCKEDLNLHSLASDQFPIKTDGIGNLSDAESFFGSIKASLPRKSQECISSHHPVASALSESSTKDEAFADNHISATTIELCSQLICQIMYAIVSEGINGTNAKKDIFDEEIPSDFDACQKDISRFANGDVGFVPEELDCDRHLQKCCRRRFDVVVAPSTSHHTKKQRERMHKTCKDRLRLAELLETVGDCARRCGINLNHNKYSRMLDIGVPMAAVEHALHTDMLQGSGKVNSGFYPTHNNDEIPIKYFKMLKLGVPPLAVKNAMRRDGFDPTTLESNKLSASPTSYEGARKSSCCPLKEDIWHAKYFKKLPVKKTMNSKRGNRRTLKSKPPPKVTDVVEGSNKRSSNEEKAAKALVTLQAQSASMKRQETLGPNTNQTEGVKADDIPFNNSNPPDVCLDQLGQDDATSTLLKKWEVELMQLHEMGFSDNKHLVNVLENLEAARMEAGVTSDLSMEDVISHVFL
uniref:PB1 domain-containing protein n=2 Tax=Ditylum brightwellii TaxID=49249 RepID=A0A7S4VK32_9STRA